MGRDLEAAPGPHEPDRSEPLALGPERIGQLGHERLDLVRRGIGREIDVGFRAGLTSPRPPGDAVAHRSPYEEQPLPGRLKALGDRRRRLEHRT